MTLSDKPTVAEVFDTAVALNIGVKLHPQLGAVERLDRYLCCTGDREKAITFLGQVPWLLASVERCIRKMQSSPEWLLKQRSSI